MRPDQVSLSDAVVERLDERAAALLRLGTLAADTAPEDADAAAALRALVARLRNTYPYPDASYVGQMLKPPAPVAWAAYATAMLLNPNNHALDGGPATAQMEREAVDALGAMLGVPAPRLGHLTSSGTIANLESLWVARELAPGATVVSSESAHYTHARMCALLGVDHEAIRSDSGGRMDPDSLAMRLRSGGVGTVVATLGSTALGALDDLDTIADLCAQHGVRLHVDAAYGGFFALLADGGSPGVAGAPFAAVARADSVVIDPHKHGLQPYGCGCVLFADPSVARFYAHDSPYTYFTAPGAHLGEISLECSRAGAAAAALWATLQALPLTRGGLGRHLAGARTAGLALAARLAADDRVRLVVEPELDIVCCLPRDADVSVQAAFDALAAQGWHAATLRVDGELALRFCLMKPAHTEIVDALADAVGAALSR
jgi:glutamate/tyrosine decarboxylase-like PLP-dependent enzyme